MLEKLLLGYLDPCVHAIVCNVLPRYFELRQPNLVLVTTIRIVAYKLTIFKVFREDYDNFIVSFRFT